MHTAVVPHFEIAAMDPDALTRFYALLFGWRFSADDVEAGTLSISSSDSTIVAGTVTRAAEGNSGGLSMIVDVDDVLENVCYAEELGGHIIELPHEIICGQRQVTVASFADPEGNRVGLANRSQKLAA